MLKFDLIVSAQHAVPPTLDLALRDWWQVTCLFGSTSAILAEYNAPTDALPSSLGFCFIGQKSSRCLNKLTLSHHHVWHLT